MLRILRFFFSSRCSLFHNATFFDSCNIHILNTECAKILKKIPAPKGFWCVRGYHFFPLEQQLLVGHGLLAMKASRSHCIRHTSRTEKKKRTTSRTCGMWPTARPQINLPTTELRHGKSRKVNCSCSLDCSHSRCGRLISLRLKAIISLSSPSCCYCTLFIYLLLFHILGKKLLNDSYSKCEVSYNFSCFQLN